MAILSQLAIVLGMMLIGLRHFDNIRAGIAAATLYLLLALHRDVDRQRDPRAAGGTAWSGRCCSIAGRCLPARCWAWRSARFTTRCSCCRCGSASIGRRACVRFLLGFAAMVAVLVVTLAFTSSDMTMFLACLKQMFGVQFPIAENLRGAWQFWNTVYRYPIIAAFIGLSISFVHLAAAEESGHAHQLLGRADARHAILARPHGGGLALAWYLPLLLLTIFRPNLEDRVATAVVK